MSYFWSTIPPDRCTNIYSVHKITIQATAHVLCIQLMYKKFNPCAHIMPNIFLSWFPRVDSILEDCAIYLLLMIIQTICMGGCDRKFIQTFFFNGLVLRFQTFNYKQAPKITTMHCYVEDIVVFKVEKCFMFSIPSQAWISTNIETTVKIINFWKIN